jgi:hypothetical protein
MLSVVAPILELSARKMLHSDRFRSYLLILGGEGVRDKHSSLLWKIVNYGRKKFHNIGPR